MAATHHHDPHGGAGHYIAAPLHDASLSPLERLALSAGHVVAAGVGIIGGGVGHAAGDAAHRASELVHGHDAALWAALTKRDAAAVEAAIHAGANVNHPDAHGDTPLLHTARQGHYVYPPAEIPALLIRRGAQLEATDKDGLTALQLALLSGWQRTAELLISSGAKTQGVAAIKHKITCPDCKAVVAAHAL